MELAVLLAALRIPSPSPDGEPSALRSAVAAYAAASERKERADVEAAAVRRPSTMKASLKSTMALERARQHVIAELRLVGHVTELPPPAQLRLCS
jgi:hypothetical protein